MKNRLSPCFYLYPILITNISAGTLPIGDILSVLILSAIIIDNRSQLEYEKFDILIFLCMGMFMIFSLFIVTMHQSYYFNEFVRCVRVAIFYYITKELFRLDKTRLVKITLAFVVAHGFIIVMGALNKPVFDLISSFTQYNKGWFLFRGNGLAGSFDTAGFIIVFGIILLGVNRTKQKTCIGLFLLVTGFFTGRTFMYLGPIIFFVFHILPIINIKNFFSIGSLVLALILALILASLIGDYEIDAIIHLFDNIGKGEGYYNSTGRLLAWAMDFMTYISWFGHGEALHGIDIGYFKTSWYGGFTYLLIQTFIVLMFPIYIIYRKPSLSYKILGLVGVYFVYNFKIYAFFAGIFTPMYYLTLFALFSEQRNGDDNNARN